MIVGVFVGERAGGMREREVRGEGEEIERNFVLCMHESAVNRYLPYIPNSCPSVQNINGPIRTHRNRRDLTELGF